MRVLVLGADGFVGRRVMAALATSGWATPVAGSRRARNAGGGERIVLDATDADSLANALTSVDAVVNCIAGDAETIRRNAEALFGVAGDRRIVHLSSMAVYGAATGRIGEDAALSDAAGAYGDAKVAAEHAATANTVLLRPGCIYGPGSTQWSLRIAKLLDQRRVGDLGAAGDGCSNVVHVDDVVAAIRAALRIGAGAYNLAMADAPDWNGYFLAFARALGAVPIRRVPGWQLRLDSKIVAIPLKLAERVTGALPPPIPPSLARLWSQDLRLDAGRATRELGIAWTPLERGVAEAAAWCRAQTTR
jgi:nucleoside-diphosphate-sugar epimerase